MAFLIEDKAQVLYIAASSITENGKKHKIVIESPISWEHLFRAAQRHLEYNLRLEAAAEAASKAKGKGLRK